MKDVSCLVDGRYLFPYLVIKDPSFIRERHNENFQQEITMIHYWLVTTKSTSLVPFFAK